MSGGGIAATSYGKIPGTFSGPADAALLLATRSFSDNRESRYTRTELSIGGIFYLTSVGLVAATIIAFLFGAGFSGLLPPTGKTISPSHMRQSLQVAASNGDRRSTVGDHGTSTQTLGVEESSAPYQLSAARGDAVMELSRDRQAAPALPPKQVPAAAAPPPLDAPATTPSAQVNPGLSATEIGELLEHGDSLLRTGDVVSARLFYERAAAAGDGRAALRAGATFDPVFLRLAGLGNVQADPAEARSWYRRAVDLGVADAKRQLDNLPSTQER